MFSARNPLSLKICTAFDKPDRRKVELTAEYTGITIPDKYVVGYGLLTRTNGTLCTVF